MKLKTNQIAKFAVFTALVILATIAIQIPISGGQEYFNIGDTVIFFASVFLGPLGGLICGGLGSALADLLTPYAFWAPYTLVIKGLEGLICGLLFRFLHKKCTHHESIYKIIQSMLSMLVSGFVMVIGYFFAASIMAGSFAAGFAGLTLNLIQISVCSVLATILVAIFINKFKFNIK